MSSKSLNILAQEQFYYKQHWPSYTSQSIHPHVNNTASERFYLGKYTKSEVMAFTAKESIGSKTCINDKILGQFYSFNYPGCNVSYEGDKYLNVKPYSYFKILYIINKILILLLISKHTRI
jgi:hypothetical protein